MEGSEHLATIADDVVEIAADSAQLAEDLLRATRHRYILAAGVGIIGLSVGFAIGYRLASKRAELRFEVLLEAELAKAKEVYDRKYKVDDFATPGDALATLHGEQAAVQAMQNYKPAPEPEVETTTETTDPRPPVELVVNNIFSDSVWNEEQEKSKRAANPDLPYVISEKEYMAGDENYEQITLAYYEEDSVLADAQEKPIDDVENVVGEDNLLRFGHGSGDPRVVYIRNNRISVDFEVVKSQGSYENEVLGFKHSDRPTRRRMRPGDDG